MPWDLFPGNRPNKPQSPNDVAFRPLARDPRCKTLVVRLYGSAGFVRPLTKYGASLLKTLISVRLRISSSGALRTKSRSRDLIFMSDGWLSVADLSLFSLAF